MKYGQEKVYHHFKMDRYFAGSIDGIIAIIPGNIVV